MKKTIAVICMIATLFSCVFAQGTKEEGKTFANEDVDVRVIALKGPTSMGLVQLMNQSEAGPVDHNAYTFSLTGAVDEVTTKIVKGDVDIAAIPANLASVLYNNTKGKVKVVAINTLGVIYILENGNTIKSVQDLKGRTIYASGKGATPEYGLNYVLKANGLEPGKDVNIEWKSEHAECATALTTSKNGIAMLPQPFVTIALMKNSNIRIALDLTKEWEKKGNGSAMITGVMIVRTDFVDNHKQALDRFLSQYATSVEFANTDPDATAKLIGSYNIVPEEVAKHALPYCNIVCITGTEMENKLSGYLQELYNQNPKAVGGALPPDEFYYSL
ncbi:MAG: ABC transporter substrate-binding protein [Sphaerochaetaceae bacterium]